MNTYHPAQPRIALAVAAIAAAAVTLGALIVVPVQIESSDETMPAAVAAAEPHVDSDRVALAIQDRERRHDLVARAIGAVERGARMRLAGAPLITAPQETRQ